MQTRARAHTRTPTSPPRFVHTQTHVRPCLNAHTHAHTRMAQLHACFHLAPNQAHCTTSTLHNCTLVHSFAATNPTTHTTSAADDREDQRILWKHADRRFFWNWAVTRFLARAGAHEWIVPVMNGFIHTERCAFSKDVVGGSGGSGSGGSGSSDSGGGDGGHGGQGELGRAAAASRAPSQSSVAEIGKGPAGECVAGQSEAGGEQQQRRPTARRRQKTEGRKRARKNDNVGRNRVPRHLS